MVRAASYLLGLSAAVPAFAVPIDDTLHTPITPSLESAQANAYHIFNAIHSAGRQWGSSIYHNGFGFIPSIMPKGTLTYHGGHQVHPPKEPDWLAFEMEHAEQFAYSFRDSERPGPPPPPPPPPPHARGGKYGPLQKPLKFEDGKEEILRGYLHVYRANRDLNLLYVDGLAAAKTNMGTLDSQDLLLRENKTEGEGTRQERERANEICQIISEWGYDGFVRTEIGFEVVYCDFYNGLDLVSSTRTYLREDKIGPNEMISFQWARAVSERYDGLGGNRLRIDFSSMVSGFFFPINVSSTWVDRPDLIRLEAATLEELKDIKTYLHGVATQPRRFTVDWQAVVDMITTRYADRLALMGSEGVLMSHFIDELDTATLGYVNAPALPADITSSSDHGHEGQNETDSAIERCIQHFLLPVDGTRDQWSREDGLIHFALQTVMQDICFNLFSMRAEFLIASGKAPESALRISNIKVAPGDMQYTFELAHSMTRSLMEGLGWAEWKRTRRCAVNEVLFVAMWPFGSEEDHWDPGCRSIESMNRMRMGYWTDRDWKFPPAAPGMNDEL